MNQEFWMWARIHVIRWTCELFPLFRYLSSSDKTVQLPVLWHSIVWVFQGVPLVWPNASSVATSQLTSLTLSLHSFFYILFCSPTDVQRIARQSFSPIHSFEIFQIEKNDQKMVQKTKDAKCLSLSCFAYVYSNKSQCYEESREARMRLQSSHK